jgi:small-conductance mechanosensitive channel
VRKNSLDMTSSGSLSFLVTKLGGQFMYMMNFSFFDFMQLEPVMRGLKVLLAIMFGYLLGKFAGRGIERTLSTRLDVHQVMVFKRFAFYSILILATITGLNEAGVNLNVLVGAAGVASVAIGFASQTTMSNLVSGIFILLERPFLIGDTIKVGNTTGEVSLMGLFSTILKTPENMMVRIPNEILMKSEITNVTRYPIRRLELFIGVSYAVDIAELRTIILGCVSDLEFIRKTPAADVNFKAFSESAIQVAVGFWVERERATEAFTLLAEALKRTLDTAKIEIPVPQRGISFGPEQSLKVQVVSKNNQNL